eukprot:m.19567 g.19567  ORF g.19567 m.19567 type:complete len:112 (+) comp8482_c0_seq4:173-508(+)
MEKYFKPHTTVLKVDDNHLRRVETDVVIPKMVQESAKLKCADFLQAFSDCAKGRTVSVIFKCKEENKRMQDCIIANSQQSDYDREKQIFLEKKHNHRLELEENMKKAEGQE